MENPDSTLEAFAQLGSYLRGFSQTDGAYSNTHPELSDAIRAAQLENPWFTPEHVHDAIEQWAGLLDATQLLLWLKSYSDNPGPPITVALILAGNVPLVGFHDFLCVLLGGHKALVKCASKDKVLLPFLAEKLMAFEPELRSRITFVEDALSDFDAVIATGSDNTSRYFEHYFGKYPHIIRKNRHSVAVLTGEESVEELSALADDVFRYFGMGCRSVSKLFVPEDYDFDPLFKAFYAKRHILEHTKYANNYDYNKAVYLMSGSDMLDNGFLLLKEDKGLGSPIGTLFYQSYTDPEKLNEYLQNLSGQLQCIVGAELVTGSIPFGQSQMPGLDEYADGVDTMKFLLSIPAI